MIRIVHITDTHLSPRQGFFYENFARVAEAIAPERADLVVNTGDLTINGAEIEDDLRFAAYCHGTLSAPLRVVPGNHDVGEEPDALHLDQPVSPARLERYRAVFGADHWVEDRGPWRLIGLNALILRSGLEAERTQEAWLAERLAEAGSRPLGLFIHKPLFIESAAEPADPGVALGEASRTWLAGLFGGRALKFVCSGHLHQSRVRLFDGVHHVWGASTAFPTGSPREGAVAELGYAVLDLSDDGRVAIAFRAPPGLVPHDYQALKGHGRYAFLKDIPPGPPPVPWPR